MEYKPIDYRTWDKTGRGANIWFLLEHKEKILWDLIPFHEDIKNHPNRKNMPAQDARDDSGHGEAVTYFGIILCPVMKGNREIAVPSAMLHDTGYVCGGKEFRKAVKEGKDYEIRLEHQIRAAHHAYNLLTELKWSPEVISEVQFIIADHDTRLFPTTPNGEILWHADYLWRFTAPCFELYTETVEPTFEVRLANMQKTLSQKNQFFNPDAREIAEIEMVNTLFQLHKQETLQNLRSIYPEQLEKIVEFYQK